MRPCSGGRAAAGSRSATPWPIVQIDNQDPRPLRSSAAVDLTGCAAPQSVVFGTLAASPLCPNSRRRFRRPHGGPGWATGGRCGRPFLALARAAWGGGLGAAWRGRCGRAFWLRRRWAALPAPPPGALDGPLRAAAGAGFRRWRAPRGGGRSGAAWGGGCGRAFWRRRRWAALPAPPPGVLDGPLRAAAGAGFWRWRALRGGGSSVAARGEGSRAQFWARLLVPRLPSCGWAITRAPWTFRVARGAIALLLWCSSSMVGT